MYRGTVLVLLHTIRILVSYQYQYCTTVPVVHAQMQLYMYVYYRSIRILLQQSQIHVQNCSVCAPPCAQPNAWRLEQTSQAHGAGPDICNDVSLAGWILLVREWWLHNGRSLLPQPAATKMNASLQTFCTQQVLCTSYLVVTHCYRTVLLLCILARYYSTCSYSAW